MNELSKSAEVGMNSLTIINEQTMSSLEIAELVESRHDKVKQSIERLIERGIIQQPPMGEVKNHKGQSILIYQLCKRDSYVVVAQLSPEFTARLVDRWQELETKNQPDIPKSYSEALKLAYEQSLVIEDQSRRLTDPLGPESGDYQTHFAVLWLSAGYAIVSDGNGVETG